MESSPDVPNDESKVTVTELGPATCIALRNRPERIDFLESEEISNDLLHAVESALSPRVIIDLTGVEYFSSWFLTTLNHAWQKLRLRPDWRFGICGLNESSAVIFKTSRMEELWEFHDTVEQAVETWSEPA